ncbi:MAG: hydantoinase B/oxoprolinase family protein [Alphaproteobacteria bacterium]
MKEANIDPITLTVIWNGLLAIAEEMGSTLRRTAFSEAVREGEDFSTGVFDIQARLVAQGNFTPGHLGSMPYVVRTVLEYFPVADLHPGDAILLNDSFLGSGHFPDCFLVSPAFLNNEVIGFVCTTAHHIDVGGAAPGSQKVHGVTEAYQEGLRILPIRLIRAGEFDADILRIILGNVRAPEKVRGDLRAQANANRAGVVRLEELHSQYGRDVTESAFDEILERSEKRMRELIGDMPDGVYSFDDQMDDYGPGTPPIKVAVDVTINGDVIEVDFSRSSDQVPAALNSYINYTRAYTFFAVKVYCDALLPQNDGGMRPIIAKARPGSFFNPTFPAPSGGRAALQIRIFDAINGALAKAMPHRAMGAFSHWSNPNIGGLDPETGKPFVMYDLMFGGYGGRSDKDGAEALAPVMNCRNIPVEVHETHNPVRIHCLELIQDTGGAGKYRGGLGLRKDIELLAEEAIMTGLGDRHDTQPYGIFGGKAGARAETILNPDTHPQTLGSKDVTSLRRGDIVSFRLAGAGGYGPPAERDLKAIRRDIADGYISFNAAARDYGVKN